MSCAKCPPSPPERVVHEDGKEISTIIIGTIPPSAATGTCNLDNCYADALLNEASLRLEEYRDAIGSDNYVMRAGLGGNVKYLLVVFVHDRFGFDVHVRKVRDFRVGLEAKCVISRYQQAHWQAYLDKSEETHNGIQGLWHGLPPYAGGTLIFFLRRLAETDLRPVLVLGALIGAFGNWQCQRDTYGRAR